MTQATGRMTAILAKNAPPRAKGSSYPQPFASRMAGREKRPLGDLFGLHNFGVNLTSLAPGAQSSLLHRHSRQDEFIFVLEGHPTLVTDSGQIVLTPGMCAGFPAGKEAHHLINNSSEPVLILEIGDRTQGDQVSYPEDDLVAEKDSAGWRFKHKDRTPYPRN